MSESASTGPGRRRGLPGALVLVVIGLVVGALIGGAVAGGVVRIALPAPPAATAPAASSPVASSPAASSSAASSSSAVTSGRPSAEQQAIQTAIQRANDAQVAAIAKNDPTLLRDSSTAQHYAELVKIDADLLASGVTSITLAKLEWGTIDIAGSTARAVTYETWQATSADGTTQQSRDQNDYTLVLQSGTWLIQANDQPAAAASPALPSAAPGQSGTGTVAPGQATSSNWSGYSATGGTFTSVTGTWIVPDPTAGSLGADATWVGIGGVASHDLIQAGTQTTVPGGSTTQFGAWIEMLPQSSQPVPLVVVPGDSVTVSITSQGSGSWLIEIKNNTSSKTYSTTVAYASTFSSAEWIEEAPSGGRTVLPIDAFGVLPFSNAQTVKDGKLVTVSAAGGKPVTMINSARQPLALPSSLGPDGATFSVTRTSNPATVPLTPGRRRTGP
ncbi:MAG: G1 family endopeptidase [Chloroflexota bacterium]|nr:G1 family endopeptidase [Chloroflexota bacterium]